MRHDSVGFFWEDLPVKRGQTVRQMPPIPETGWKPPTEFPNLFDAECLAIDTETYDPELLTYGPGWGRNKGHIVGISVAAPGTRGWYFPIRHEVETENNLDAGPVLSYFRDLLRQPMPKIGANLIYDVGWLEEEDIQVNGTLYDIQYAEALLDSETPHVALDDLAYKYLGKSKETSILYKWCYDYYGGSLSEKQRANIYRSPPSLAGPYGEADATLPMQIMAKQWPLLEQRGCRGLFEMECGLIRLLIAMRRKGVPVDIEYAEQYEAALASEVATLQEEINHIAGFELNPGSPIGMQRAFDSLGLEYLTTAIGNPSFPAHLLERTNHALAVKILEMRRKEKIRGTFLESYILNSHVNGRVHGQFHLLRSDENGTRSGRFSSSTPNLQNIPIRTEEGKKIRNAFVAHGRRWISIDYSQIEYRLFAHYALGHGSDSIRERYANDPNTDYHDATIELIYKLTGIKLDRKPAKNINFGLLYGMGKTKLLNDLGEGSEQVYDAYHRALPFVKDTADACSTEAQNTGQITTLLGRVSDFNRWEPVGWHPKAKPLPLELAVQEYGSVQRSGTHKALNRRLQGSAADIMKAAMWRLYHEGYFDAVGIPLLTVHDELDFDDESDATEDDWKDVIHTMEHAVDGVSVPIVADFSEAQRWGDCK